MVPEGWNLKKLGEIATTASGSTPKRNIEEYWEGGSINWVATGEIDYKPIFESEEKITEKAVKDHSLTIFPKGSVLMAMYGQGTTRGKVGILATEAAINQNSCAILTNPLLTISEYIYYYLEISYTALRNLSNGGGQQNLNNQLVRSFEILLPPLPEQQKIADILSTWDKAIEKQEALIAAKQKRKRGLMQQLLTGKVRFKGFEGKWKRHKLKEVCEKSTPQINPSNFPQEEFEYYSIPAFQETGQPSKTLGEEIKSNKLLIESGVVLFGKLNPRILKIWKVESNSKARKLASTEFMPLIPSSTLNLSYLY
ncbi:MAG: restriction endonuclease subunit S, partial [Trueperaceae bacterium]|nr:restriction endonuclease subunit S [Trueperaceae bacterium]